MHLSLKGLRVPVDGLRAEPFSLILCYPKLDREHLEERIKELKDLGVTALEFQGEKQVFNVPVLGKGCVGLVVLAYRNVEKVALKIRRTDADRAMMQHEAEMLKRANAVDVGPKLFSVSRNFLLMHFIEGVLLPEWLERVSDAERVKRVLRNMLEQCWRLDKIHLDHGELSRAPKHIIVNFNDSPFIVDFESASLNRKPANVTSLSQFLFISGKVAEKVALKIGEKNRDSVIEALRRYKADGNRESFERILRVCGL